MTPEPGSRRPAREPRGLAPVGGVVAVLLLLSAAAGSPAGAVEVRFPLTVDYDVLRHALGKHLRELSGGALELWRTADGCGSLVMRDLTIEPAAGRLKIAGRASAEAGLGVLGLCWASVSWDGYLDIIGQPEIGPDWQLRLTNLDTRLSNLNRESGGIASGVWAVARGFAESEISRFAFDVGPQVTEIRSLLALFAGQTRSGGPLLAALQTLRSAGVAVEPQSVRVVLALDVAAPPALPRGPEAALTPEQIRRWEAALDRWDGFLGFVVKDLAGASPDPSVRADLLDLLLSARHDLVAILGRGPEPGVDPVKSLFLSVWTRLRQIARRIPAPRGDESRAFRLIVFLSAGDALAAIEAAAPTAGVEISADGLRRLAKTLDPAQPGDPLQYSEQLDPQLRQLFRFRDPDSPPRRPRPKPSDKPADTLPARGSWWWLTPRAAFADEASDSQAEWLDLGRRLNRWVPTPVDSDEYRATVQRLLTVAAERTIDADLIEERFDRLFQNLVKATAWQESCWHQFWRRGQNVTFVISRTGDVGMMQINVRVWRGFFNADRLRWNAAYNAGAGAEILFHHLVRFGLKEGQERMENAARASYSAYNGGPARYRRYRLDGVPAALRAVDRAFFQKYQALASGQADIGTACFPRPAAGS